MDIATIKVQFPDVKFFMFVGRSPSGKRIKGQMFPKDVAVPVWDLKTQKLLRTLPYVRLVDEKELGAVAVAPEKKPDQIVVPANWWTLHHKRRIALARALTNGDIRSVARADEILNERVPRPAELQPAEA